MTTAAMNDMGGGNGPMEKDRASVRQVLTLLGAALLSPMIQLLPRETVAEAGRAGWLSALLAIPAALIMGMAFRALVKAAPPGTGLAGGLEIAFGRGLGRCVCGLYLLWGIALLGWNARWAAFRFLITSYQNARLPLFFLMLIGGTLWVGRKKRTVFLRAAEIYALALGIALAVSLFFGAMQSERACLFPIWVDDLPGTVRGIVPVLGILGYGVFAALLVGCADQKPGDGRRSLRWLAGICVMMALFQAVCIAVFGPGLIGRLELPYFMLVKDLGVDGAFQRVESVIMSLWVLADLALLGLLFLACREILEHWNGGREEKWIPWGIAVGAVLIGMGPVSDEFQLSEVMEHMAVIGNIVMGIVVPGIGAVCLLGREKKKVKRMGEKH